MDTRCDDFYQHSKINDATNEAARLREEVAAIRSAPTEAVDDERMLRAIGELALEDGRTDGMSSLR